MWRTGLIVAGGMGLAACETVSMPGMGARGTAPAEMEAPAEPVRADGVEGAALCLAASEYVLAAGGVEAADQIANIWNSVLDVIPAEEARKTGAARDIYGHFANLDSGETPGAGLEAAMEVYEGDCADADAQRAYLREWGDPELMARRIDTEDE